MSLTPEELNQLKQLKTEELLLLTYQLSHETNRVVKDLVPRVEHLERFQLKISGAWAALVVIAGAAGLKLGKH